MNRYFKAACGSAGFSPGAGGGAGAAARQNSARTIEADVNLIVSSDGARGPGLFLRGFRKDYISIPCPFGRMAIPPSIWHYLARKRQEIAGEPPGYTRGMVKPRMARIR